MRLRTIPTVPVREPRPTDPAAGVVLLHGLARTRLSMRPLVGPLGRLFGPAAGELSTATHSLPCRLGPADFPLGILIGDRGAHWPLARCFTGANDGKVAVARARLEGMADFRVVDCGHAFIMRDRRVQELVVRFLRAGEFGADDGL